MELAILDGKRVMDSRDISILTGKQHKHIIEDIERMLLAIQLQPAGFSAGYKDAKGEIRKRYLLPYRETMILCSGYSVELRAKIIDRWLALELSFKEIRDKSKRIRYQFTDTLKNHGYDAPHQYIQTTLQMKKALGISSKKDSMGAKELKKIQAAEAMADLSIDDENGFYEVNPKCVDACYAVVEYTARKRIV